MINKEKIKFDESIYWVPSYTGPRKISILEEKDGGLYVVQSGKNKFLAHIEHIYNKQEHAIQGRRDWEHYERKRKRNTKNKEKNEVLQHKGTMKIFVTKEKSEQYKDGRYMIREGKDKYTADIEFVSDEQRQAEKLVNEVTEQGE